MEFVKRLPDADELKEKLSLTSQQQFRRNQTVDEVKAVLRGESKKKIICIGPCSADREDAVLDYMLRLAKLSEEVQDGFLIIPRIYTGKPRTNGRGYKGLVHRPDTKGEHDDIYAGLEAMRKMHLHIIQQTGMFGADEMLYPEAHYYITDLLAYTAVGARSVENQQHRLVASGLDMPVGMKNPTSGDTEIMLNAVLAGQSKQALLYHGWECHTSGNPYTHIILRGYTDACGKVHPNYHFEDICDIHDAYYKMNLKYPAAIIDCNHGNSRKMYDEQIRIAKEIITLCKVNASIDCFVKGIMLESYLIDGAQKYGEDIYGKSITDPCLGWEKTRRLVLEIAEMLG